MKLFFVVHTLMLGTLGMAQDSNAHFSEIDYCTFQELQDTFESVDGEMTYIDIGTSQNVVMLLHGVPTSGWLYRKMIDSLVDGGVRVIVPDMLGFGGSASPKGYDLYTPQAHAKRLLALMDSLGIEQWCHVFHDFGGQVTWEMLRQDSSRANKLIVLNTIIYEDGFHPPVRMKRGPIAHIAMSMYRSRLTNKFMLKQLFKMSLHDTELTKTEFKGYQWPLLSGKTKAMYTFFTNTKYNLPDYSSILKGLTIPVHVVWGKYDEVLTWDAQSSSVMEDLNIKQSNVHIVEASHFVQEEVPHVICGIIINAYR